MNYTDEQIEEAEKDFSLAFYRRKGTYEENVAAGIRAALATLQTAPEPVSGDVVKQMCQVYKDALVKEHSLRFAMNAAAQVCIADNNAQWEKATREELPFSNAQFADFIGRVKSHLATPAPTLREEIEKELAESLGYRDTNHAVVLEATERVLARIEKHEAGVKGGE